VLRLQTEPLACLPIRNSGNRRRLIQAEGNDVDTFRWNAKAGYQLSFHLFRMHENVVHQMVLYPKGAAIQPRIPPVAFGDIDVMRGKYQNPAKKPEIELQECAIEQLEFFVPQDVEHLGIAPESIPAEAHVIADNAVGFSS
jgi:hypothetical protein